MAIELTYQQQQRVVLQYLQSLQSAGVEQLRHADPAAVRITEEVEPMPANKQPAESKPGAATPKPTLSAGAVAAPALILNPSEQKAQLEILQTEVAGCTRCTELAATRTQTVFGVGDPSARLCFLGEAPGADEDAQGEPFVGRAGQLLTKMIQAMTLSREEVYILNILKCRPPGNRNPSDEEAENCRGFLDRQLQIIQPQFICCLGAVAAKNLLQTKVSVGKLRGRLHDYQGSKVVVTYHPAYLLRNPAAKKPAWEDLQMLMSEMELGPPHEKTAAQS